MRCLLKAALEDRTDEVRVQHAMMRLRLTTLIRCIHVAHVGEGLWTHESRTLVNITVMAGHLRTISITGPTLELRVEYPWRVKECAISFLFRHSNDRSKPLCSERISKLA